MSNKILISYASKYGSTEEVAAAVGERLRERGFDAEVRRCAEVNSLDDYGAVVVASPFYIGSLLKDARKFLHRHRAKLEEMPVALLTLGPTSVDDDMAEAKDQIDRTLAQMQWLKPVVTEMFVGKYDPSRLRGLDKLATIPKASPLHNRPLTDDRDWDAIKTWADHLPAQLGVERGEARRSA